MASRYVTMLKDIASKLKQEGFDYRFMVIRDAAERMERMEDTIVEMHKAIEKMQDGTS